MTSLQRVLTTLGHQEPDRVPFFLLLTMHGAKELGMSIKDYFSKAGNIVEGQLRLRAKYRHDCIYNFFYAPLEIEAWGGSVVYHDEGPPNSGEPFIKDIQDIKNLEPPDVKKTPCLIKVFESASRLKQKVGDDVPIIGVVMSPFSLPVMQLGFDKYFELMYEHPCYSACNNDPVLKKSASKNAPPLIYTFHEIFHGGQEDVDSGNDSKNSAVLFCRGTEHQTDKQRPERIQKHGP